jgi:hypothetical protein
VTSPPDWVQFRHDLRQIGKGRRVRWSGYLATLPTGTRLVDYVLCSTDVEIQDRGAAPTVFALAELCPVRLVNMDSSALQAAEGRIDPLTTPIRRQSRAVQVTHGSDTLIVVGRPYQLALLGTVSGWPPPSTPSW